MGGRVVVTGGDAGYFPLIEELAQSLRAFHDAAALGLAVIDGGLLPEQKATLAHRYGARVLEVGWASTSRRDGCGGAST